MIVYLAWGSLYWNPDLLPISRWIISDLKLPLEFSRISDKGKGRLTLVIDDKNGSYNNVWYAKAKTNNINDAIKHLRRREKTTIENIAYINFKNDRKRITNTPNHVIEKIEEWGRINGFNAVIWTDLKSNWKDIMKVDYNVERSYKYFNNSPLDVRLQILEYVYKAKNLTEINTNFSIYFFKQLDKQ